MENPTPEEVRREVHEYLMSEFLPDEDPAELQNDTSLVSSGVLDSIATAKLVSHLESRFDIRFGAHEVNESNLDTIDRIVATIQKKL